MPLSNRTANPKPLDSGTPLKRSTRPKERRESKNRERERGEKGLNSITATATASTAYDRYVRRSGAGGVFALALLLIPCSYSTARGEALLNKL